MINTKSNLVIIGAGGHAKVCYDIAQLMNKWNKIIILDDDLNNDYFHVSGPINDMSKYLTVADFFVAIGNNSLRGKIINKLEHLNAAISTLIHPQSVVASDVNIGIGSVIMAGVVINSSTSIGKGGIINTSVSIDHDNLIEDFVHISPGSNLAGTVKIGSETWVGLGCKIIQTVIITKSVIIGAGSTVIDDVKDSGTYIGSPIKKID